MAKNKEDNNDENLKLVYVLKIGENSKHEFLYEMLFRYDINFDVDALGWMTEPCSGNSEPPIEVDVIYQLKLTTFQLDCLHEQEFGSYYLGYRQIMAIAWENENEIEGFESYQDLIEENDRPLLIFYYGITLKKVKDLLYARQIIFKGDTFVEASKVKFK